MSDSQKTSPGTQKMLCCIESLVLNGMTLTAFSAIAGSLGALRVTTDHFLPGTLPAALHLPSERVLPIQGLELPSAHSLPSSLFISLTPDTCFCSSPYSNTQTQLSPDNWSRSCSQHITSAVTGHSHPWQKALCRKLMHG